MLDVGHSHHILDNVVGQYIVVVGSLLCLLVVSPVSWYRSMLSIIHIFILFRYHVNMIVDFYLWTVIASFFYWFSL